VETPIATDELLSVLADHARAQAAEDEASDWAAVARGELDLAAASERAGLEGEALERAQAYFEALDIDTFADGLEARLADLEGQSPAEVVDIAPEGGPTERAGEAGGDPGFGFGFGFGSGSGDGAAAIEPAANHDPGRAWWWVPGGMLAAAAAAIVLFMVWPRNDDLLRPSGGEGSLASLEAPLPSFGLETEGGLKALRGDGGPAPTELRYRRETEFSWLLRPEQAIEGEVGVRAFAVVSGSSGLPLDLEDLTKVSRSGSIQVAGSIRDLDLEPGRYTILLAVGRPGALPDVGAALAELPDSAGQGDENSWQLHRLAIVIED